MNKQGKNGIGWCDYTWNPIKGMCPVNCKLPDGREYCYARDFYRRVLNKKYHLEKEGETIIDDRELLAPYNKKTPLKIFVCSTYELFHPSADWTRKYIFDVIKENPQHIFQVLTKMPENIDREMPDNVWLGVSVTNTKDIWRLEKLDTIPARIKFVSFEPLLEYIPMNPIAVAFSGMDWAIIGRLTGHGKKYDPLPYQIRNLVHKARVYGIPVFLKDNLQEIVKTPLIQEFPE